jgi:RNA polymerase sigma-70 factor (ECF subfamily)
MPSWRGGCARSWQTNWRVSSEDGRRAKRDVTRERSIQQSVEASSMKFERLLAADGPSPEDAAARNERALRLASGITKLPQPQREAIELHYWHYWTLEQIGKKQVRSKSAVAGMIRRGLKGLKEQLAE